MAESRKLGTLVIGTVALVAGLVGSGMTHLLFSFRSLQQSALAGQTLVDLSRAIEREKTIVGRYPDSIAGLKVENSGVDFSPEVLKEVVYFKTDDGFVAFVGLPDVAFIHPGVSTLYR